MIKRSAPSSPTEHYHKAKKLKPADAHESTSPPTVASSHDTPLIEGSTEADIPATDPSNRARDHIGTTSDTAAKNSTKLAPADHFRPWKPKPAYVDIPEVQPHWGIIPRPGAYTRPSQQQPSARESGGAVRPALWQDRKGAVRLKRGERIIKGYDQAIHMWLPLMDLRPHSKTGQPRREAIGYYYKHGMPIDWTDTVAINDLNKALQAAIKSNAYEKEPWTQYERETLANIFAQHPDISLLDAAEQFNELAHPTAKGGYPRGRFTESIQHEFQIYKSSYVKGEAPNEETEKDIPLEQLYKTWKDEQGKAKAAEKKKAKHDRKETTSTKMSDKSGVTKTKKSSKKKEFTAEELAGMVARADATAKQIEKEEAEEKAAAGKATESAESSKPMTDQPLLSDKDQAILEAAGAYSPDDIRPSSPISASTRAIIASSSYGETAVTHVENPGQQTQVIDVDAAEPDLVDAARPQFNTSSDDLASIYTEKAARVVEIDESYDDETED